MELHLTATEIHLPYRITQCYPPPDTSEHFTYPGGMEGNALTTTLRLNPSQTCRYSIYLPQRGGRLSGDWLHTEMVYQTADRHPSKYKPGSARPKIELAIKPVDYKSDALTTTPPSHHIIHTRQLMHCFVTLSAQSSS